MKVSKTKENYSKITAGMGSVEHNGFPQYKEVTPKAHVLGFSYFTANRFWFCTCMYTNRPYKILHRMVLALFYYYTIYYIYWFSHYGFPIVEIVYLWTNMYKYLIIWRMWMNGVIIKQYFLSGIGRPYIGTTFNDDLFLVLIPCNCKQYLS